MLLFLILYFNRWFAKAEDDGKIVRELLPTDEHGNALETGLQGRFFDFLLSMITKHTLSFFLSVKFVTILQASVLACDISGTCFDSWPILK